MADAVVTMGARWDGRRLSQGLDTAKRELGGLKRIGQDVGRALTGPLGFIGITAGAFTLGKALRELAEEERQMGRLVGTIERLTGVAPSLREINAEMVRLRRSSLFGDTELTAALQGLVQLTGDYSASLKNLSLVADIAAGTGKSLNESLRLVGFAMKGIVEPLGEINPAIRLWAMNNRELVGTAEGAATAIGMLYDQFGGARVDELKGNLGAWNQMTKGLGELRDALSEAADSGAVGRLARHIGDWADKLAEANRESREAQRLWGKGGVFSGLGLGGGQFFNMPTFDTAPMLAREAEAASREQAESEEAAAKAATERAKAYVKMLGVLDEWKQRGREMRGGGRGPDFVGLPGEGEDNPVFEKYKARTQQMANDLQSAFTGAFMSMRNGWEGLVDYMRDYLIQQLAIRAAGALVGILFPGSTQAAGGGLLGGPGIPTMSVGASSAVMQQNAWRMQRSLR